MKEKKITFCALLLLGFSSLHAQVSLNTSGKNAIGVNGSVSYTIGEILYTEQVSSAGSVQNGVQQVYSISILTSTSQAKDIELNITSYPNPTSNDLNLSIKDFDFNNSVFQLYNLQGELLINEKVTSTITKIQLSHLPKAVYILKILNQNQEIKNFKIIKNQ